MARHRFVWMDKEPVLFVVEGEGDPYAVKATPVVTEYWFGITVGFFLRTPNEFAFWQSSSVCDLVTAWRVAQFLPRVKTLRDTIGGYNSTLCGLVIAMQGGRHEDRMRALAKDLDITDEQLDIELHRLTERWPSTAELCIMWDRLSNEAQNQLPERIRQAIEAGKVESYEQLISRIGIAELRLRSLTEQKQYEDTLIAAGLDDSVSLRRFLLDIGVTNLVYTLGCGDPSEPTHFNFDDLDHEIMWRLIGSNGFGGHIYLLTTRYWSDFGDEGHPRVMLEGKLRELIYVRWDRVTERFMLTLRPVGLSNRDDSQDVQISIAGLRDLIGVDTGLKGQLDPGETPAWLKRKSFWQGLGRFRRP